MLAGDRTDLPGKLRSADGVDLIGMDLGAQAVLLSGLQDLFRFARGKNTGFAEYVAKLRQLFVCNRGDHLLAQKTQIVRALFPILRRQRMGAHKGCGKIHRMCLVQPPDHA